MANPPFPDCALDDFPRDPESWLQYDLPLLLADGLRRILAEPGPRDALARYLRKDGDRDELWILLQTLARENPKIWGDLHIEERETARRWKQTPAPPDWQPESTIAIGPYGANGPYIIPTMGPDGVIRRQLFTEVSVRKIWVCAPVRVIEALIDQTNQYVQKYAPAITAQATAPAATVADTPAAPAPAAAPGASGNPIEIAATGTMLKTADTLAGAKAKGGRPRADEKKGMTQAEVAERLGCSIDTVRRLDKALANGNPTDDYPGRKDKGAILEWIGTHKAQYAEKSAKQRKATFDPTRARDNGENGVFDGCTAANCAPGKCRKYPCGHEGETCGGVDLAPGGGFSVHKRPNGPIR